MQQSILATTISDQTSKVTKPFAMPSLWHFSGNFIKHKTLKYIEQDLSFLRRQCIATRQII